MKKKYYFLLIIAYILVALPPVVYAPITNTLQKSGLGNPLLTTPAFWGVALLLIMISYFYFQKEKLIEKRP